MIFWDCTTKRISRSEFEKRWPRVAELAPSQHDPLTAWQVLVRLAGESKSVVSVAELRKKLARLSPPLEVCRADFGLGGPLFGTIHGSKGREADHVALMLPRERAPDKGRVDPDEEARVLFVGATRARLRLVVVKPYMSPGARVIKSGRACILSKDGKLRAQIEIGREGDLSAQGLAGKSRFTTADEVHSAQSWLLLNCNRMASAVAVARGPAFAYHVSADGEGPAFALLESHVNHDLFEMGRLVADNAGIRPKLRPSKWIPYVRIFGARSLAAPVGMSAADLHEPWGISGFMLAPLVQAFTMIDFMPYDSYGH